MQEGKGGKEIFPERKTETGLWLLHLEEKCHGSLNKPKSSIHLHPLTAKIH